MSSDGLKPIAIHSPPGPLMGGAMGGMTTPTTSQNSSPGGGAVINNDSKRDNPFLQFVANARYVMYHYSSPVILLWLSETPHINLALSVVTCWHSNKYSMYALMHTCLCRVGSTGDFPLTGVFVTIAQKHV